MSEKDKNLDLDMDNLGLDSIIQTTEQQDSEVKSEDNKPKNFIRINNVELSEVEPKELALWAQRLTGVEVNPDMLVSESSKRSFFKKIVSVFDFKIQGPKIFNEDNKNYKN